MTVMTMPLTALPLPSVIPATIDFILDYGKLHLSFIVTKVAVGVAKAPFT